MVDVDGTIHRIISDDRVSKHAGRSLWNGQHNINDHSIGIEVVGYHDAEPTAAQYAALKGLLSIVKKKYRLKDADILSHAHIAYGKPNRWFATDHRGRKKCGMIFANGSVRKRLGLDLHSAPTFDPDFQKGRVINADTELADVLYGKGRSEGIAEVVAKAKSSESDVVTKTNSAWAIARDAYDSATTVYTFPDKRTFRGDEIADWGNIPEGTKVSVNASADEPELMIRYFKGGGKARGLAGDEFAASTTIYFFKDGRVMTGAQLASASFNFDAVPEGTGVAVGYVYGGHVSPGRSMISICGKKWNDPSTIYRLPGGEIRTGDNVDEKLVPKGTLVLFQR